MAEVSQAASLLGRTVVESPAVRVWRRLLRRKGAIFGLFVIGLFVAFAVLAPLIAPYDPIAQKLVGGA